MKTDREAIMELRDAQLKAGHMVNTRKAYRGWILRYREARRLRQCRDLPDGHGTAGPVECDSDSEAGLSSQKVL